MKGEIIFPVWEGTELNFKPENRTWLRLRGEGGGVVLTFPLRNKLLERPHNIFPVFSPSDLPL